ncbi:hypothetical protein LTR91_004306 [Friedmanniomyces endolithicus]|uniref:Zn(2)-C6 fungal-type domain-containing protein n=1 Tax=Friedmanniomyces endolithicus TaxID=329885 RepID=A0AAN6KWF1_9PEZI|nr:hypothetical protein LTR57_022216 [Friedmanniomyces endolithicus]KAK1004811.1 hypothetical protein LTR91_004306 [Friedmanniomyces endolithicus]KAK1038375.1 hypothetical protein LTS16_012034 [Friedmanniomyces endolithicus]
MPTSSNQQTPPDSHSSNGTSPINGQQFRVVRKRNRIPLSCAPCRHRKLKCNRGHPCDNCTKRGDIGACNYAMPGSRRKGAANGANGTPDDMQNRIDRLEGLVLSLMANGQPGAAAAAQAAISSSRSNSLSTGSELRLDPEGNDMIEEEPDLTREGEDSDVEQVSKQIGIMKVDNGRTVFASEAHWYAILGEISEVKQYFTNHREDYRLQMERVQAAKADESPGTAFLLQGPAAKDKAELLAQFPNKTDADRLIARYFNAYDPSVHIIHGPLFQKQYDLHWMQPMETSTVWIGLCFAMMTLALQSYHRAGDEPPEYRGKAMELAHTFRRLTAQCLLLADITQPIAQILETLILHVQAEYGRSRDAEPSVLLMVSLCVRLAMRMGYHRDPSPHPQIKPFDGEIRRRVWAFVRSCDVHISFQFGLPPIVRTDQCDTQMPRNVYDDELYEDMKALPVSRPTFEATPMIYMIAKSKMTLLFGRVIERVQSLTDPPPYEEIMKFDQELHEARSTHPPLLQMRSFPESARDPANLIMQRLGLEMVYLRSLFVLHRRFSARGRENPKYAYSRRTCIDASMQLLDHQATLHRESQPGGRLRSVKWYISSLTTHDFLLAAMMVCLDMYHTMLAERGARKPTSAPLSPAETEIASDRREEMLCAVDYCITIWESLQGQSMEAYKASRTLRVMAEKIREHQRVMQTSMGSPGQQSQQGGSSAAATAQSLQQPGPWKSLKGPGFGIFPNNGLGNFTSEDDLPPEQSAAMTLGMLSCGGMSPNPNFVGAALPVGQQQMSAGADRKANGGVGCPANMAGLLNESAERSGLTPGYSGAEGSTAGLLAGAASPFSQMMASVGNGNGSNGFMGMDGLGGGDIDWGAWDQYIQGSGTNAMDPSLALWPMNLDIVPLDPSMQQNQQQQPQQQHQANGQQQHQQHQQQQQQSPPGSAPPAATSSSPGGGGGVFMGATTPSMMQ